MTETESKIDIRFDWSKQSWKVIEDGYDLDEEFISCNDAIAFIEKIDPRTAEELWLKYFCKREKQ